MIRKVVLHSRAQRELVAAMRWWSRNRDKAPAAFDEDLAHAWDLIQHSPHLMERVRYYVYYRVLEERIEVISFGHASRRPPRL